MMYQLNQRPASDICPKLFPTRPSSTYEFVIILIIATIVLWWPDNLTAGSITGKLINGTTQRPATVESVLLLQLKEGMELVDAVDAAAGTFVFTDISDTDTPYLLQVEYLGIRYNHMVRFLTEVDVKLEVTVFDTTSSSGNLRTTVPHFFLSVQGQGLRVEKIIEIENQTNPPKTYANVNGTVPIYIPDTIENPIQLTAATGSMPINVEALPTAENGIHRVDYALKPGKTSINLTYELPYNPSGTRYEEINLYPVSALEIVVSPPDIVVDGAKIHIIGTDPQTNFTVVKSDPLRTGELLAFQLTGAGGASSNGHQQTSNAEQQVRIVRRPSDITRLTGFYLVLIAGALAIGIWFFYGYRQPDVQRTLSGGNLLAVREALLNQLAHLDDTYDQQQIESAVYHKHRVSLKKRLYQVLVNIEDMSSSRK